MPGAKGELATVRGLPAPRSAIASTQEVQTRLSMNGSRCARDGANGGSVTRLVELRVRLGGGRKELAARAAQRATGLQRKARSAAQAANLGPLVQLLTGIEGAPRAQLEHKVKSAVKWVADQPAHKHLAALLELVEINLPNLK